MGRVKKKLPDELRDSFALSVKVTNDPAEKISKLKKGTAAFIAPELVDSGLPSDVSGYEVKPSWDVAIRFQDLKRLGNIPPKEKAVLRRRAIEGVLARAYDILGAVIKPERHQIVDFKTFIESGQRGELDVLSTLDEELARGYSRKTLVSEDVLRFDARLERDVDIALVMDASLSMTGEKIALLAVSTAVVALCVKPTRLSLMGFDSKVRWIKRFGEELPIEKLVERVLELPAGGFTNMELALNETAVALSRQNKERANVILIGDGKYTEGGDPSQLAERFRHLNVLKIGRDQAGRDLMLELSARGQGKFFEARRISDLPRTMYGAMKRLLR
ncbi:MAG: VWA domain-containing protein [Deltaproteobacteria bacterium]|nr:VWA domain-containing protein [Deltaproteobacteria bacterium]